MMDLDIVNNLHIRLFIPYQRTLTTVNWPLYKNIHIIPKDLDIFNEGPFYKNVYTIAKNLDIVNDLDVVSDLCHYTITMIDTKERPLG